MCFLEEQHMSVSFDKTTNDSLAYDWGATGPLASDTTHHNYSFTVIFKRIALPSVEEVIVSFGDKSSSSTYFAISLLTDGTLKAWDRGVGAGTLVTTVSSLCDGTWHCVTATMTQGSPKTVRLYVDGSLIGSATGTGSPVSNIYNRLGVGRLLRSSPSNPTSAVVAELAMFNAPIPKSQHDTSYNGYSTNNSFVRATGQSSLIAHWKLDFSTGVVTNGDAGLVDHVGSSNLTVFAGTPDWTGGPNFVGETVAATAMSLVSNTMKFGAVKFGAIGNITVQPNGALTATATLSDGEGWVQVLTWSNDSTSKSFTGYIPATAGTKSLLITNSGGLTNPSPQNFIAVILPGPTTTGYSGTLVPSGSLTLTTPGQTIQNVDVSGQIIVQAANVTIRNFRVTAPTNGSIGRAIDFQAGAINVLVEDGEIIGSDAGGIVASGTGTSGIVRRCNIHDTAADATNAGSGITFEANWVHHIGISSDDVHADAFQTGGGSGNILRHNFFDIPKLIPGTHSNSCVIVSGPGTPSNLMVERNFFNGGNYTIYAGDETTPGLTFTDNLIGPDYAAGTIAGGEAAVFTNNQNAAPQLRVTGPSASSTLTVGLATPIQIQQLFCRDHFDIEVSYNGGSTWTMVAAAADFGRDWAYSWSPTTAGVARLRLTAYTLNAGKTAEVSGGASATTADFAVGTPSLRTIVWDSFTNVIPLGTAPIITVTYAPDRKSATVTISCDVNGATIKYSTNGRYALTHTNSPIYTVPIVVKQTAPFHACWYFHGFKSKAAHASVYLGF